MPRIRTIKPEFFTDSKLGRLSPLHRILFAGLWTQADREGRLKDDPDHLKVVLLPFDDCHAETLLADLHAANLVIRYHVKKCGYIAIPHFSQHQRPNIKEHASTYPAPTSHVPARKKTDKHALERKGKEGNGKGKEGTPLQSPPGDETRFEQFWTVYPRKIGKGAALKAWLKISPDAALTATIITKLAEAVQSEQWTRDGGQFIPHPTTWLNRRGWEDEYTTEVSKVRYGRAGA